MAAKSKSKTNSSDERWMDRALALARRGEARASPNPMVGAVLVRGGRVVGEGFHTYDGVKHAEILALERAGKRARGATLYINLEPCCHLGRTGPCTKAIIGAGVKRVVAAMQDPNPAVAGKGFAGLRRAGIAVEVGLCEDEARELNEAFAKWITTKMPFVMLKIAMTHDGKIAWRAPKNPSRAPKGYSSLVVTSDNAKWEAKLKLSRIFDVWAASPRTRAALRPVMKFAGTYRRPKLRGGRRSRWITSLRSRQQVQRLRHSHDAILTGIGTVLADDPLLTDRTNSKRRRRLLRVVLDSKLRLPVNSRLVKTAKGDVIVFTALPLGSRQAQRLRRAGVELVRIAKTRDGVDLRAALKELGARGVTSVLVEAGQLVNSAILSGRLADKLIRFIAPVIAGRNGLYAVDAKAGLHMVDLLDIRSKIFGGDLCIEGHLRDVYGNH